MPDRLQADEVKRRAQSEDSLLICAYNDTEKCNKFGIENAIAYPEIKDKLDSLPKSTHLMFFCA